MTVQWVQLSVTMGSVQSAVTVMVEAEASGQDVGTGTSRLLSLLFLAETSVSEMEGMVTAVAGLTNAFAAPDRLHAFLPGPGWMFDRDVEVTLLAVIGHSGGR
jgi:hypothetical protein